MSFGTLLRQERRARGLTLRGMAKTIGVSPTSLSKIERDAFPPPSEDKVKAIAEIIDCDPDELLALAERHPIETAAFLRAAKLPTGRADRALYPGGEEVS